MGRMRRFLIVGVGLLSSVTLAGMASAKDVEVSVNEFYQLIVQTLKIPEPTAERFADLVTRHRSVARTCLSNIRNKCSGTDARADAFRMIRDHLEIMIMLTGNRLDCSRDQTAKLLKVIGSQAEDDDRIFCLEKLVRLCSRSTAALTLLGDLYYRQQRWGMAADAYEKALSETEDSDTRALLAKARTKITEYTRGSPITEQRARKLYQDSTLAAVPGVFSRKVVVREGIQRRILFDEWSDRINLRFIPELNALGRVLSEEFARNPAVGLLIEGHADRRGPRERNFKISSERAESIKAHLVQRFEIEAARIQTKGFGPMRPFSPRDDSRGWALNRRVEFKKIYQSDTPLQ